MSLSFYLIGASPVSKFSLSLSMAITFALVGTELRGNVRNLTDSADIGLQTNGKSTIRTHPRVKDPSLELPPRRPMLRHPRPQAGRTVRSHGDLSACQQQDLRLLPIEGGTRRPRTDGRAPSRTDYPYPRREGSCHPRQRQSQELKQLHRQRRHHPAAYR